MVSSLLLHTSIMWALEEIFSFIFLRSININQRFSVPAFKNYRTIAFSDPKMLKTPQVVSFRLIKAFFQLMKDIYKSVCIEKLEFFQVPPKKLSSE